MVALVARCYITLGEASIIFGFTPYREIYVFRHRFV